MVDFGIAKATEAPEFAEMSTTGALKGKIRYMAPEQLRGDHLDRRADVFSMGVVLWEAVANGARMWAKEDDITVIMSLSDGIAKAPEAADPNVQPELAGIMRRALAGRPDERYRSADAFRIELDRYIARIGGPIGAREIGAAIDRAFAADKRELDRAIHAAMDAAEDELDDAMTLLRSRESMEEGMRAVGHSKDALKALFRTPTAADPIPRIEHSTSAVVVIPGLPHEIGPSFDAGAPLPGPKRTGSVLLVGVSAMAILVLGVAALAKLRLPGARPAPTAPFGRPVPAASGTFDMVNPPVFPAAGGTGSGPAASAPSASSTASAPPSLMASALAAPAESGSRWSTGAPIGPVKTGSPTQIARPAPAPGAPTTADPAGKPTKKVAPKPASPGDGEDPPLHL